MNLFRPNRWIWVSLVNLLIVALLGVLMRTKIAFTFPWFDQKHIQFAHNHFAFTGWITHTLYALIKNYVQEFVPSVNVRKYRVLIVVNLLCAYGILISFANQGYGFFSEFFSIAAIVTGYVWCFFFFRDMRGSAVRHLSKKWFKAALLFNVLSSAGTFLLVGMMISKHIPQKPYLASVYYFLHFQYNGFFFFGCMGLLFYQLKKIIPDNPIDERVFSIFAATCIPAYFLSTLWLNMPLWLYVIVVISAALQVFAWGMFINNLRKNLPAIRQRIPGVWQVIFLIIAGAITIKLLLQLGSVIPELSRLAFGFRPIVIAYLHLVLLAGISLFLLVYLLCFTALHPNRLSIYALLCFVGGVVITECILMVQGVAGLGYTVVPYVNEALFGVAVFMFLALLVMFTGQLLHKILRTA